MYFRDWPGRSGGSRPRSPVSDASEKCPDWLQPIPDFVPRKAIEWFVNYEQSDIGPSSLDPAPDKWDGPFFLNKRMAIMMSGYWFGGNIFTASDDIRSASAQRIGSR